MEYLTAGAQSRRCRTAHPCRRHSLAAALALGNPPWAVDRSSLTHKRRTTLPHRCVMSCVVKYHSCCRADLMNTSSSVQYGPFCQHLYMWMQAEGVEGAMHVCCDVSLLCQIHLTQMQGAGPVESAGAEEGHHSDLGSLQQRIEALEKELAESENTHRLR